VFKFLAWLHGLLFRLVLWVCKLPLMALWSTLLAVVALLGEEMRRYLGLAVMGAMIWLVGKGILNFAPDSMKLPLVLTELALVCIWGLAVLRAIKFTLGTSLRAVRQRMWFRELRGDVRDVRGRLKEGLASATRDTPISGVFRDNRDRSEQARQAEAAAAAEREADDARRDELADLEPDPYTWEHA